MCVPIGLQHRDLPGVRILCIPDVTASGLKARLDTPLLTDLQKLDCSKKTIFPCFNPVPVQASLMTNLKTQPVLPCPCVNDSLKSFFKELASRSSQE